MSRAANMERLVAYGSKLIATEAQAFQSDEPLECEVGNGFQLVIVQQEVAQLVQTTESIPRELGESVVLKN